MVTDWDEELDSMLFSWTAGMRLGTMPLIDAMYYIRHGRHHPSIKRSYPDEVASKGLIDAVRKRMRETQEELRSKYPSGVVPLYRGGGSGQSWTTVREQAEFFAKGEPIRERSVSVERVAFYLEPYTREAGEEEYILEGELE